MIRDPRAARLVAAPLLAILLAAGGCFAERSMPVEMSRVTRPTFAAAELGPAPTTRAWVEAVVPRLAPLLPADANRCLTTRELLRPDGRPIDVPAAFGLDGARLYTLADNLDGLTHTAQATGPGPGSGASPPWSGFDDILIPVADGLELAAKFGRAERNGEVAYADCIVVLPGLLGNNNVMRTRDLSFALRDAGWHVLAVELRGCGLTDSRQPHVLYNFGVTETGDLLAVDEWLKTHSFVRRTGLIGFCWGANHALLAAFEDSRPDQHASIAPGLAPLLRPRSGKRHFEAGVLAFSAVLSFEQTVAQLDTRYSVLENPVLHALQNTVLARMREKQFPNPNHSLMRLIELESERTQGAYPGIVADGLDYLRLAPFRGKSDGNKLKTARIPVLLVHGANDPLAPAQDVANLVARTDNPNVAAIVLRGGGHVGFAPYARDFFYSLVFAFFDPRYGPAALAPPLLAHSRNDLRNAPDDHDLPRRE
ncbi:MAG: alpha/beta fold hydrolase [Phycisphaerae bacterium]